MNDALKDVVGKRIQGILVKERETGSPRKQLFLLFTDGTFYELWSVSSDFRGSREVDHGGLEKVRRYAGEDGIAFEIFDESPLRDQEDPGSIETSNSPLTSIENTHLQLLSDITEAKYVECAKEVIAQIKSLGPECRTSGDDSGLENVWEEFKSQVQGEESLFLEAYEETIRSFCEDVVTNLTKTEFKLLWLWSTGYDEWDEENSPPPYCREDVVNKLYSVVCNIAVKEEVVENNPINSDKELD